MCKKAREICITAFEKYPSNLEYVPDHFKTQEMCEKVVEKEAYSLQYVPDWFVTREWIDMWCNGYYDDDGNHGRYDWYDIFFEWHEGYQKRKVQKAKIKEELLPIAWYPSRYWDWCMSEDEKRETEKLWA